MPSARPLVSSLVPFLPVVVGFVVGAWCFRAGYELGGLGSNLAGVLGMIVLAIRVPSD